MTLHRLPRLLSLTPLLSAQLIALLLVGCAATPGGNQHGLDGDGSVADPCAALVCASGQRCELVATPCAPETEPCEPVPVCVPDVVACTIEACGDQPPTLPCADESPSQACARDEAGECGWQQLECPHVGDPCVGCEPCPTPELGECRWTELGVCSQVSASCM